MPIESIRKAWDSLSPPADPNDLAAHQIEGTNAWVFKSSTNGFGLVLTDVSPPAGAPKLRHLRLEFKPVKTIRRGPLTTEVRRCLQIELDPVCDPETLARILDRLREEEPSGRYQTPLLLATIQDMLQLAERMAAPAPKDEVIGAWGELFILKTLIPIAPRPAVQRRVISAWESTATARDIIDFRFPHGNFVIEAKTTTRSAVHRFHALEQVIVPPDVTAGYVASVLAVEASGAGTTCKGLVDSLLADASGTSSERKAFETDLMDKLDLRGPAALDDRFAFLGGDPPIKLFAMADVPRPTAGPNVSDVEWTADLSRVRPEPAASLEAVFRKIAS